MKFKSMLDPYKREAVGVILGYFQVRSGLKNVTISGRVIYFWRFSRTSVVDGEFTGPFAILDVIIKTDKSENSFL